MDDEIFSDGSRRLKVSVAGVDRAGGSATTDTFRLTVYAYETQPTVRPLFTAQLDVSQAARLYSYLNSISIVRDTGKSSAGPFIELGGRVPAEVLESLLSHPD
jgi:hypothetical protein